MPTDYFRTTLPVSAPTSGELLPAVHNGDLLPAVHPGELLPAVHGTAVGLVGVVDLGAHEIGLP